LICATLSSACLVLAAIIRSIGRTAVARDDQRQTAGQGQQPQTKPFAGRFSYGVDGFICRQ
jgi:hypothetical protein